MTYQPTEKEIAARSILDSKPDTFLWDCILIAVAGFVAIIAIGAIL